MMLVRCQLDAGHPGRGPTSTEAATAAAAAAVTAAIWTTADTRAHLWRVTCLIRLGGVSVCSGVSTCL